MNDKERIAMLEARVAQLESMNAQSTPWSLLSKTIERELGRVVDDHKTKHQVKSAMTCILGKAFHRRSVCSMTEQECKDSKILMDTVVMFLNVMRDKYKHNDFKYKGDEENEQRVTNF